MFVLDLLVWVLVFLQPLAQVGEVNPIIGNRSYYAIHKEWPTAVTDEHLRVKTHLQYVERYLRTNVPIGLSFRQKRNRRKLLNHLRDYWKAEVFPVNVEYDERKPCFIDQYGNICAVGYLIEMTAGVKAAKTINHEFQYATIDEMKSELLEDWITTSGLTKRECAMIQPAYVPYRSTKLPIRQVSITSGPVLRNTAELGSMVDISLDKFNRRGAFRPWAKRMFRYRGMGFRYERPGNDGHLAGVRTFASFLSYRRYAAYGAFGVNQWLGKDEYASVLNPEIGILYRKRRWKSGGHWWFNAHASYKHGIALGDGIKPSNIGDHGFGLRMGLGYAIYWNSKFKLIDPHKLEPKSQR